MDTTPLSSWIALVLLGAVHGLNPAMGWLFAVSLGLQEQSRRAVWGALGPLAIGHVAAVGLMLVLAAFAGLVIPAAALRWVIAAGLVALGCAQLVRHRHPRFGGMRVGMRDLALWSFLMASAHGAGLMALPFVMGAAPEAVAPAGAHVGHGPRGTLGHETHSAVLSAGSSAELTGLLATLVHTAGYLLLTGLLAVVVYEKLGLRLLRRAWINLDVVWSWSLIATGILTVVF